MEKMQIADYSGTSISELSILQEPNLTLSAESNNGNVGTMAIRNHEN